MKVISLILILFGITVQLAIGDSNIYGPHGENLGPNPDIEQVFPDLREKKELEVLQDQNRQLQQQVQGLEY